jgi:hypothetical protein
MITEIIIAIVGLSVFVFVANAIAPSLKDHEACQPKSDDEV